MQKDGASSPSRSTRVGASKRSTETTTGTTTPAPFEGETTINSQSDYARELLAQAIGEMPSIEQNAEIRTALAALKELVNQQSQVSTSLNPRISREFADYDPAKLDRPPLDVVETVFDTACSQYPFS